MWFSVISAGLLAIATSVTAASSITVYQTTACTSSTPTPTAANPFLVPNADDYPFRAGEVSYITWTPTTSDTISLTLDNGTQFSLAEDIPNTGYFEWTPDASLINANEFVDIFDNTAYVLLLTDGTTTSQSPSLYVLSPTYPADFYNISTWRYPTVGEPTTIIWSPSTASGETTITRQLVFGNGEIPGPSNTITIGDQIPNTGSWVWDVPSTFTPGEYVLSGFNGASGFEETSLVTIIVGAVPVGPC